MVVQDGGVASVMASYNRVNTEKSTVNHHMLTDVLRTDFGFQGFVLSDWWAMDPPARHQPADELLRHPGDQGRRKPVWTSSCPGRSTIAYLESIVQSGGDRGPG